MTALPAVPWQSRPFPDVAYVDNVYVDTETASPEAHEGSFADIVERLFRAFEDHLPLGTIVGVVKESREHLRGSPVGALPELTERLARERLSALSMASESGPTLADTSLNSASAAAPSRRR